MAEKPTALAAGEAAMKRALPDINDGALQSGDPILFYAGAMAAMLGNVGAALGGEAADAMIHFLRPLLAEVAKEKENVRTH
jgi:hypothetical protein